VQDDPEEMQGPVDDSEENLQFSFNRSKSLDYEYLSFVTGGYFQDGVISTSNIERAQMIMTSAKRGVIIEGPKGCGKTTLCCTLYQLSKNKANSNFDCIFLSSSFQFDYPGNYFNRFLEKHKDHLEHFKPLGTAGKSNFCDAMSMVTGKIKLLCVCRYIIV